MKSGGLIGVLCHRNTCVGRSTRGWGVGNLFVTFNRPLPSMCGLVIVRIYSMDSGRALCVGSDSTNVRSDFRRHSNMTGRGQYYNLPTGQWSRGSIDSSGDQELFKRCAAENVRWRSSCKPWHFIAENADTWFAGRPPKNALSPFLAWRVEKSDVGATARGTIDRRHSACVATGRFAWVGGLVTWQFVRRRFVNFFVCLFALAQAYMCNAVVSCEWIWALDA